MARHEETVRLGRAGIEATRLGLGTAPLGGMFSTVPDRDAVDLIVAARNAGIELFDTAPFYGNGVAERRLREGLAAAGSQPRVLETKVGRLLVEGADEDPDSIYVDAAPEQPVFDFSADGVRRSFESSLQRLGVDRVDTLLIHDAEDHEEQALREAYPALEKLRSEGLVSVIGVAMDYAATPTRFVRETDIDLVLIAGRYTMLDQSAQNELFPAALERSVSVITAGVFNSGILADPRPEATYEYSRASPDLIARTRGMERSLAHFGVPLRAAALQFPLRHPAVNVVLTGVRHKDELLSNIEDFNREIPDECWAALEQEGLIEPVRL